MKYIILIFILFPSYAHAQIEVILNVNQPPELGYEITSQDTTIIQGDSINLGTDLVVFGGSGNYLFHWSAGDVLSDSSIINPIAYPDDTITFFLTVVDSSGCSFSLSYTVNVREQVTVASGINKHQDLKVILFPNPNSGKFNIQLSGEPLDKIDLIIIDNSGRTIKRQILKNFTGEHTETLEINLPGGIYNLLIDNGIEKINRRFIIN